MEEKIKNKLYKMWLFREEITQKDNPMYAIRDAKLNGAVALAKELGFKVDFNPLANVNENPFSVKKSK